MASLLRLFRMRLATNATSKKAAVPSVHSHKIQPPSVMGIVRECLAEHPKVNEFARSRILSVIICLKAVRGLGDSNILIEAEPAALGEVEPEVKAEVEAQVDAQADAESDAESETDVVPDIKIVDISIEEVKRTEDSSERSEASLANMYGGNSRSGAKWSPPGPVQSVPKFRPEVSSAGLQSEGSVGLETDDPIPSEYNLKRLGKMPVRSMTNGMAYDDVDSLRQDRDGISYQERWPNQARNIAAGNNAQFLDLSEAMLERHTLQIREAEGYYNDVPQGPYPFMANPEHPAPEIATKGIDGYGMSCPDGCVDCEVFPHLVMKSKRRVDGWFKGYFTLHDLQVASWVDPQEQPHQREERSTYSEHDFSGIKDDETGTLDLLYGATTNHELSWLQELHTSKVDVIMRSNDPITCQMMRAELAGGSSYAYFHGRNYNAIVAEYEPRYLPKISFASKGHSFVRIQYQQGGHQLDLPVWEARGGPVPGQNEKERIEYTRREYRRQWDMYREQDSARMRYIATVQRDAAKEWASA